MLKRCRFDAVSLPEAVMQLWLRVAVHQQVKTEDGEAMAAEFGIEFFETSAKVCSCAAVCGDYSMLSVNMGLGC